MQLDHNQFPNWLARDLGFSLFLEFFLNAVCNAFDGRVADGPFLAGFTKSGNNFSAIVGFTAAIFFDYHGENVIKTFVGSDSSFAVEALTATADNFSFLGES
jgi:hypothetical protein